LPRVGSDSYGNESWLSSYVNIVTFVSETVCNIDIQECVYYDSIMKKDALDALYQAFGNLVRLNRERRPDLTQEKLGRLVGLSRTSIVNIEKGRQHIALHQLFALAEALKVRPEALLPSSAYGIASSWLAEKLPPGTEKEITEWAEKLVGESR